ncbi:MAG: dienelactone hydrolase family protein [Bryobacterales bacterium]|nr:dienelactone hydrolase family protein [Bryobacterales bacterium]MDE0623415.1 dienelactone hydrolase family protein [Bryobacterales bacterium]
MTRGKAIMRVLAAALAISVGAAAQTVLPAARPLETSQDLAVEMVEGIHRFLDRATQSAASQRDRNWRPDFSSPDKYWRSVDANRERLKTILGVVDPRLPVEAVELVATTDRPAKIAVGKGYEVLAVRWEALPGVFGEGLLLQPDSPPRARIVAIPDASWSPETLVGIQGGIPSQAQFARRLAENGCQVLVPTLIDRTARWTGLRGVRESNLPHREFLFRMSYELGRHVIGYELQRVLGAIDLFESLNRDHEAPIGVIGYGEGGLLALYAAALDRRISSVVVSGYFQEREGLWQETIDRNVWSLLAEFGDAKVASLVAPRRLTIEASQGPDVPGPPAPPGPNADRAASGRLVSPQMDSVRREFDRVRRIYEQLDSDNCFLVEEAPAPGTERSLQLLIDAHDLRREAGQLRIVSAAPDQDARMRRQFDQIVDYNHRLVRDSPQRRSRFWAKADASSVRTWKASTQFYRDYIWDEVIGRLPEPDRPASPKTRRIYDHADFEGYEVVLEVWEDVFAYGVLLVPKGLRPGERRPVVVAQHGLEGRPTDLADPDVDHRAYHRYGARLAQEGFVVYAPQNPYIGRDRFRQIWRKAHPLKLSLYSFIVGQHQQTLAWLKSLPFVDGDRIGFYGLSYGGKTAMRIPPLLDDYALSICSADFNEWVWKNTSTTDRYSYLFTQEYDMLEFNFANVINYAELATLMAPRPFMVERGHSDGVAPDEWVAYEFAKVRRFYDRLGLGDKTEIEFFDGPHEIHGKGTFDFLRKHLDWR